jgi:drug/metabolite transporter (DMT)-like permease
MTAVELGLLSALLFGAMSVALRMALQREPDVALGTIATVVPAIVVAVAAAALEVPSRGLHLGAAWPFLLAGLLSPGAAQILVTIAIRESGASRVSMVFGTAPLVSVAIALAVLGEPVRAPLLVGAVLVVAGGVELTRERERPGHLRRIGLLYAFGGATLFAIRDNVVRHLAVGRTPVPPGVAAAAALVGGGILVALWAGSGVGRAAAARPEHRAPAARQGSHRSGSLRRWLPFLPAGLLFGGSYVSLFEAYYRGRVTVVAPLVAIESLVGVALSVLLLRDSELVGKRLVLGAALIVAGGALIGAFR